MEETSGRTLGWFFDQWLVRPGSPVLEGSWTYNPDSNKILLDLTQTQAGAPFRLPLDIGINIREKPAKIEKIEMTDKTQRFQIPCSQEPASLELDPNVWVLTEAKLGKR